MTVVAIAIGITVWAVQAFGTQHRVSSDLVDVRQPAPSAEGSALDQHILWMLDAINGDVGDTGEVSSHFSKVFLAAVPVSKVIADTRYIAASGPYEIRGTIADADGFTRVVLDAPEGAGIEARLAESRLEPGRLDGLALLPSEPARGPFEATEVAVHLLAGWALLATGVAAALAGTSTRWVELLLQGAGLLWLAQLFELSDQRLLYTIGLTAGPAAAAMVGWVLYQAIKGTTSRSTDRLMAAALVVVAVLALAPLLFVDTAEAALPGQLLAVAHDAEISTALLTVRSIAVIVVVIGLISVVWNSRTAGPGTGGAARFGLAALTTTAVAVPAGVIAAISLSTNNFNLSQSPVLSLAAMALPLGMRATVIQGRSAADMAEMVADVGTAPARSGLQESLARALGDPSVALVFWSDEHDGYVDSAGTAVDIDDVGDRAVTRLKSTSQPIGAVFHDSDLRVAPERVRAAVSTARLALDNERLQATVRAQLADVRASRARLAESAEQAQRRVERNLHDGAQQRLLALLLSVKLERSRSVDGCGTPQLGPGLDPRVLDDIARELGIAIAELRELGAGLYPSALDHGLKVAIDSLAERNPVPVVADVPDERYRTQIEAAAYFVVAESVTNATRHSHADLVRVAVCTQGCWLITTITDDGVGGAAKSAGTGLQSLEDRVLALGGRLRVLSPTNGGTTVTAQLPIDEVAANDV